jgi:SPP1 family predicted phage head-tail adaptor
MDPGKLKERVTLQRRAVGTDAMGQASGAWTDVATVWALVLPLRGREFFAAAQVQQELSIKVTMRYRADVEPTMRLMWQGKPHDITGVVQLAGQRDWLEVMALGGVKDGR